jgi:exodeoxyribonuclease VIII
MHDLFIDLETLDTSPTSIVTEIAWAHFDPKRGTIQSTPLAFYPCPWTQLATGRSTSPDTIQWHLKQGSLKRDGTDDIITSLEHLRDAAKDIRFVWAWGSDFDGPIIATLCQQAGMPVPWKYHQLKDARTIWDVAFPDKRPEKRAHHAEDDVKDSIRDLVAALSKLTTS